MDTITTDSGVSKFFGLDIDSPWTWPGYPRTPQMNSRLEPLDLSQPIQYQGNPRYYYKWLRVVIHNGSNLGNGWVKYIYLPPGTETPICLDRAIIGNFEAVSAWNLFISRPESQDCVVSIYTATSTMLVQKSSLQRAQVVELMNCQTADFPEADPAEATLIEEWPMTQGSALLDSGNVYFKIRNTGTQTQTLVSLGSFNQYDLKDVLNSPFVKTHKPFFVNWATDNGSSP